MGNRHLFILVLVFITSCAGQKPRGQVVRLQLEESQEERQAISAKDTNLYKQNKSTLWLIPDSQEEAAVYHFSLGQAYSLDNDPQRAIESYRATLVHDPKSALVRARLAAELVKIGSYAEAKELCQEAIELDPKYVDSYLLLAGIQVAAKELEGAIDTYKKALKMEPENHDALLYYGVTLAEVGKVGEGIRELEKLVKLKDTHESSIDQSVAFYYLSKLYEQASKNEEAIAALKQALKKRPGFSKAALSLSDLYLEKKDEKNAYAVLEEAFRENHSSDLAERLSEFYMERNNFQKAVVYLETLVEEDPTNENMKLRLSLVYWQLKWFDKARVLLSGLLERYPASSEIAFYLGELEVERNDYDGAISYYKRISPDYSKYDQMVSRVAYLYRQQKKYSAAEDFLLEALQKRPDAVAFYPLLAAVYEDQQRLKDAKLALERGLKQFPEDESILYYLGFMYDRTGDKEKSHETMEKLLQINPDNPNALNFVGYSLVEKGENLPRARELLTRALAQKPDDPFILDSYGWLLYRMGKYKEALVPLEKAAALKPEEGIIAEHLGDVYASLGMPQKALAAYERAKRAGGDKEFVVRVESKWQNVSRSMAEAPRPKVQTKRVPASRRP